MLFNVRHFLAGILVQHDIIVADNSTYAIVYKDSANTGTRENNGSGNAGGGVTEDGNGNTGNKNQNLNVNDGDNEEKDADTDKEEGEEEDDTTTPQNKGTGSGSGGASPETGDHSPIELWATVSMISGFAYLLLYFSNRRKGMPEEVKKELLSRIIAWAKRGRMTADCTICGRLRCFIRKYLAIAAIFAVLVYYHSIGKKIAVQWDEVYRG